MKRFFLLFIEDPKKKVFFIIFSWLSTYSDAVFIQKSSQFIFLCTSTNELNLQRPRSPKGLCNIYNHFVNEKQSMSYCITHDRKNVIPYWGFHIANNLPSVGLKIIRTRYNSDLNIRAWKNSFFFVFYCSMARRYYLWEITLGANNSSFRIWTINRSYSGARPARRLLTQF